MRKVLGIVLVALAAFSSTAWSADEKPAQATATIDSCSSLSAAGVKEPQPDIFSLAPLPAACPNSCNNLQGKHCTTEGQHFYCSVGCRTCACTCMGGSIECGLP